MELLDKSRSSRSHTHTTSSAPAPALTPATIAFSAASNKIIDILHSDNADPNALVYVNARDDASLKELAKEVLPKVIAKRKTLEELIEGNETSQVPVSEKTLKFWELKMYAMDGILAVFKDADTPMDQLSAEAKKIREEYYNAANNAWSTLKNVLLQVHKEIIGPYTLGRIFALMIEIGVLL